MSILVFILRYIPKESVVCIRKKLFCGWQPLQSRLTFECIHPIKPARIGKNRWYLSTVFFRIFVFRFIELDLNRFRSRGYRRRRYCLS